MIFGTVRILDTLGNLDNPFGLEVKDSKKESIEGVALLNRDALANLDRSDEDKMIDHFDVSGTSPPDPFQVFDSARSQ